MNAPRPPQPTFDPEFIRDISERVYRLRLEDMSGGGPGAVKRMTEKDKDGGLKLRGRASFYDQVTRAYLEVLGIHPTKPNDRPAVLLAPAAGEASPCET